MNSKRPYQPIPCAIYSEYELAIIRRQKLKLVWYGNEGLEHIATITPLDLQTRNRAEYLIARDHANNDLCIRLDYIKRYEPHNNNAETTP